MLLAIAKCGAAYFPLDPDSPVDRLRFLLSDTDAILTIASPALRDRVPPDTTPILVFGPGEPDLSGYDTGNLPLAGRPDNLAYLISTSGSTGTPKAVAISHRALSRLVVGAPRYLDVGPGSTFLQDGPLTFDVAVLEWTPLAHGGCVVVTDTGTLLEDLDHVLRDYNVTTLKLISPQLDLIVERDIRILSGLRQLVVGGDVVNPKSFATAVTASPTAGSWLRTDRPSALCWPPCSTTLPGLAECRSVMPFRTRACTSWTGSRPASVGMRGEIYLAGDGLARGYHGRPGLTAGSFLPDPYGPPGARMYRTGDVGRYLSSGAVDFLGRADHQVKIRGFRIETSEIEHVLLRQCGITSAVVVRASWKPVQLWSPTSWLLNPVDPTTLRRELRASLPAYMVPDHIVEVPRFALTANNKVDRAALPPVTAVEPREGESAPRRTGWRRASLRHGRRCWDADGAGHGRLLRARRPLPAGTASDRGNPAAARPGGTASAHDAAPDAGDVRGRDSAGRPHRHRRRLA